MRLGERFFSTVLVLTSSFTTVIVNASLSNYPIRQQSVPLAFFPRSTISQNIQSIVFTKSLRGGSSNSGNSRALTAFGSRLQEGKAQSKSSSTDITVTDVTREEQNKSQQETKDVIDAFLPRDNRNTFIARVYAILTGQLLVTALSVLVFSKFPGLGSWMSLKGKVVTFGSILISTIAHIMMLSEENRRSSPMKWRLLAIFTIGESLAVGFISSFYAFHTVMSAMIATATATLSVTLYTLMNDNPKRDLSQWGASLSSIGTIFISYMFIHMLSVFGILPQGFLPFNEAIFSMCGACLFSLYLAYHTRLVISGKHSKYQMNEKDYVFAAMTLYADIINIFLYILRLLGDSND